MSKALEQELESATDKEEAAIMKAERILKTCQDKRCLHCQVVLLRLIRECRAEGGE